jgi:hypothetical protein
MSRTIEVIILGEEPSHKLWIFAEDLSRVITTSGLGHYPMTEADQIVDRLHITSIHARKLRQTKRLVQDVLDRHFLSASTTLVE